MPGIVVRLDRYQRQHPWLGVPLAVLDKFIEDRGPMLAGLITYYGFLSLFPLLLVLSTTLRLVLRDHPELADELLGSTLARFPVVGTEITATVHPLEGPVVALIVGGLLALYGGLGFTASVGHAFDQMWAVPVDKRPHPVIARARGLLLLVLLGVGLGVTTALSALTAAPVVPPRSGPPGAGPAGVGAGERGAVPRGVSRFHRPRPHVRPGRPGCDRRGAGVAAARVGRHPLRHRRAHGRRPALWRLRLVLALLAWIYLEALVVTAAAEINVVLVDRLWPRALFTLTHSSDRTT